MVDLTEKRLLELAQRAWSRGIPCFSDFLDLNGQTVFRRIRSSLPPVGILLSGGAEGCERKMAGFGVDQESAFPIACVRVEPAGKKFREEITHRDVLGALMSLGFERGLLGDIVLRDGGAWVFCAERIVPFLRENLLSVRRSSVSCERVEAPPAGALFRTERRMFQVASERLDALVAHAFRLSRGNAQDLIAGGKVFLDGAECLSPDREPRPGQIVSVRGMGRFRFLGTEGKSKKGRLNTAVDFYI